MKILALILFAYCLVAPAVIAQSGQPSTQNPLSSWLRNSYENIRNNLIKSAENFPEELYGMRPGVQVEVRTYSQIIGHLANFNYLWCSQAEGDKNPKEGTDFEKLSKKADLVAALHEAFAYCDSVYSGMTDTAGVEIIQITQENGREAHVPRMSLLIQNHAHNNEHYGNLVTYMRIKGIVPPSSQRR